MKRVLLVSAFTLCALFVATAWADEAPCVSGVPVGKRPGPYTFHVATGTERGQLTCYICETADKPAAVIFARSQSDALGKLVRGFDKAVADNKGAEFKAWVTFLGDDPVKLDPQIVDWSKKQGIKTVPLGTFADVDGPPTYRLNRDADVTVLLFVKQKVVANFAFRAGELTDNKVADVMKAIPQLVEKKP